MIANQLGYVVLNVSDLNAWRTLSADILGAEERKGDDAAGRVRLRLDEHHHRITLQAAKSDSIEAIGWEVPSADELEAVRKELAKRGIAVSNGTAAEIEDRKVVAMIRFRDPDGFPTEVYCGPLMDDMPFRPARPMSGFSCGALGMGHVVLIAKDIRASARFYQEVLGFKLSDYIAWDEADAVFMHCNPRHHSLAFINECYGMKSGDIHHFMLETNSLDDVGRAYDLIRSRNCPLVMTLGRHTNDQMTSFYLKAPSGFAIEYGWGGILVDDADWQVKRYSTPKLWGHDLVAG